jgi:hypothetical protein
MAASFSFAYLSFINGRNLSFSTLASRLWGKDQIQTSSKLCCFFLPRLRIRIRIDPHLFGKLDPHPHYSESWMRIRIRIAGKSRFRILIKLRRWIKIGIKGMRIRSLAFYPFLFHARYHSLKLNIHTLFKTTTPCNLMQ